MNPLRSLPGLYLMAAAFLVTPAVATTYLVQPDGTGDFATIQDAIDVASNHDTVELGDGTFSGPGNRDLSFDGKAITVRSQSGDPETCIIDCTPGNHRGFSFDHREGPRSVLAGVTITGANAGDGAAISCYDSSPTIENCILRNNWATHFGGGGFFVEFGSPTITGCLFLENDSQYGGSAVSCLDSDLTLTDCTFRDNVAADGPPALYIISFGLPTNILIDSCRILDNRCLGSPGGMVWVLGAIASFTASDCLISGNTTSRGGVIRISSVPSLLTGCTIVGNEEGIHIYDAVVEVENSIIAGNQGPAFVVYDGPCPTLSCSNIFGNEGGDWSGCIEDQNGINGNFTADPRFCDAEGEDFTLDATSPCLPGNHPQGYDCGRIGAFGEGCADPTPVSNASWGRVKTLFRSR